MSAPSLSAPLPSDADVYDATVHFLRDASQHPPAPEQLTARYIRNWLEKHYQLPPDALLPCKTTILAATRDTLSAQQTQPTHAAAASSQPSPPAEQSAHSPLPLSATQPHAAAAAAAQPQHGPRMKRELEHAQQWESGELERLAQAEAAEAEGQAAQYKRPHMEQSDEAATPLPRPPSSSSSLPSSHSFLPVPASGSLPSSASAPSQRFQPPPPAVPSPSRASAGGGAGGSGGTAGDDEGDEQRVSGQVLDLGRNKLVTVSEYRGMTLVHIREYYVDEAGTRLPGKKGIALSAQQWQQLLAGQTRVQAAIEQRQGQGQGQAQAQAQDTADDGDAYSDGARSSYARARGGSNGVSARGRRGERSGRGGSAAIGSASRYGRGHGRGSRAGNY